MQRKSWACGLWIWKVTESGRFPAFNEREAMSYMNQFQEKQAYAPGPSDAHEIEQGLWWLSIALCKDCHQGSFNGIHGQKRAWIVAKMDELKAANETNRRVYG